MLLYSYRPDPSEVATGEVTKEKFAVRIVASVEGEPQDNDLLSSGKRRAFHANETDAHYARPANTNLNYALGHDVSRSIEFWAKLDDAVADETLDRIAWEAQLGGGETVRIGFRGLRSCLCS